MTSQQRRLQQLEDFRRDLLETMGNATQATNDRFRVGLATDEDLEALEKEISPLFYVELDQAFRSDGRTREQQFAAAPAERLALDAASIPDDRPALHEALRALRHLAATGEYRTADGTKRAAPEQRSLARLLLRHLVRVIVWNESQGATTARYSVTVEGDADS